MDIIDRIKDILDNIISKQQLLIIKDENIDLKVNELYITFLEMKIKSLLQNDEWFDFRQQNIEILSKLEQDLLKINILLEDTLRDESRVEEQTSTESRVREYSLDEILPTQHPELPLEIINLFFSNDDLLGNPLTINFIYKNWNLEFRSILKNYIDNLLKRFTIVNLLEDQVITRDKLKQIPVLKYDCNQYELLSTENFKDNDIVVIFGYDENKWSHVPIIAYNYNSVNNIAEKNEFFTQYLKQLTGANISPYASMEVSEDGGLDPYADHLVFGVPVDSSGNIVYSVPKPGLPEIPNSLIRAIKIFRIKCNPSQVGSGLIYKNKYFKYKSKYFELKNSLYKKNN